MRPRFIPAAAGTAALLLLATACTAAQAARAPRADPVGAWQVTAQGAPFPAHVMILGADRTVIIDNPEAGDTATSDSLGAGQWERNGNTITGNFLEINANRADGSLAGFLVVTFRITIAGDTFHGPASAQRYAPDGEATGGAEPATLDGARITLASPGFLRG